MVLLSLASVLFAFAPILILLNLLWITITKLVKSGASSVLIVTTALSVGTLIVILSVEWLITLEALIRAS